MELLTNPEIWIALLTLTALEIVLGIDNIVFISILANKLPDDQRDNARRVGILAKRAGRLRDRQDGCGARRALAQDFPLP